MRVTGRTMDGKRVGFALVFAIVLGSLVAVGHATTAPPDVAISLQGFQYVTPNMTNSITVPVGTKVVWTHNDPSPIPHTVTSDPASPVAFDSGTLQHGGTFTFTFSAAGVYPYHCIFHGSPGAGMHGTITVVTPPNPTAVAPNFGGTGGGNPVTITGTDFAANATVMFGTAMATNVVVVNSTTITALTPPNAVGPTNITVTNPSGGMGTLSLSFTYGVVTVLPAVQQPGSPGGNPNPLPNVRKPEGPPASNPNPLPIRQRLGGPSANGGTTKEPAATSVPAPLPLPNRR